MGDLILITPALRALKQQYPDSHLTLVVAQHNVSLLSAWKYIDEILPVDVPFQRSFSFSDILGFARFLFSLTSRRFDQVWNFQFNARSYLIEVFTQRSWRKKIHALKNLSSVIFLPPSVRGRKRQKGYPVDMSLEELKKAGIPIAGTQLEFFFFPEEREEAESFLCGIPSDAVIIGINPGVNWESKRYPEERYAEVANRIIEEYGAYIVIFGGPDDVQKAKMVEEKIRYSDRVRNLAGKTRTMNIAVGVLAHCRLCITNDSGLMHCAAAVGIPTISIFGGTHPSLHAPRGPNHIALFGGNDLPCAPCYRYHCTYSINRACLHSITPESILSAVRKLLPQNS